MRLPVHIWIREENADPREVADCFVQLARRLDERPQEMRLFVESTVPASLDFDPKDGNPVVTVCGRMHSFDIRHRWLPEHPVPLEFGRKPVVLLVDPVDCNRFRVRSGRSILLPGWSYALLAVSGTLTALTLHPLCFCVTAAIAGTMIFSSRFLRRTAIRFCRQDTLLPQLRDSITTCRMKDPPRNNGL